MPGALIGMLILIGLQLAANGLFGTLGLIEVIERGGGDEPDELLIPTIALVSAAVLLGCLVAVFLRRGPVLIVIIIFEALNIVGGLITVVSGNITALTGVVISVAVIALTRNGSVHDWITR